jgi:hydrogenase expression/formation protein HypE
MTRVQGDASVGLKHGSGGPAMRALIRQVFVNGHPPAGDGQIGLVDLDDGAALRLGDQWLVLTTDSHVVHPLFFPGGDIGRLAVAGTVNDLAMMGATEVLGLTCAVILEEGFPLDLLVRIQASLQSTCAEAGATIVTGDTKVMGKGEIDGIVLNTTGVAMTRRVVPDRGLLPGDRVLVTGAIGDHGLAILAARADLGLEGDLRSDVAPLNGLVAALMKTIGDDLVAMKDPTRGGLSSALHEMAEKSSVGIVLQEEEIPVHAEVRSAGELLGIDPLHVANEGKAVLVVRSGAADRACSVLREHPRGREAAVIGTVVADRPGSVILETGFGRRLVAEPEGELLPRIC